MSRGHGHKIELNVVLNRANIQDLLWLGIKTNPPVLTGRVQMVTALNLPAGSTNIADRLKLDGRFDLSDVHFADQKLQTRIDSLSLRALGEPKLLANAYQAEVPTTMDGSFRLSHRVLSFSSLHFHIPGTVADMTGRYSLNGSIFDFHGILKMQATLSQMTTGWKSLLLRPVDPFFRKHGNGTEIPFKITGTRSEPHFGLNFGQRDSGAVRSSGPQSQSQR